MALKGSSDPQSLPHDPLSQLPTRLKPAQSWPHSLGASSGSPHGVDELSGLANTQRLNGPEEDGPLLANSRVRHLVMGASATRLLAQDVVFAAD